ncbi:FecR domain-containing protein [Maribacter sp. MMG018]|uniref:FecR family protein n=1 Tax=Maribacter sp. MMG018 TaxID=2822688 RepID=UPI001B36A677|nr:FecR domain-containing protein [Maribacter sp. MMG018]MBQ4913679.1 FecR domain-containing protein [Maribacter sp. MMG018]
MKDKRSDKKIKYLPITFSEKKDLENRILNSVQKHKYRKRRVRFLAAFAASTLFLGGLGFYFSQSTSEPMSITDYVNSNVSEHNVNSDKVTLILGKENEIKIDEDGAMVTYSNSGQDISVGSTKTISQKTTIKDEPVYNTLLVPYGKKLKTKLSDNSVVWLNSGSKMVYPATFSEDKREVYIEGEAIFEVAHNKEKPFYVVSGNQRIKVLGTVFGVTNYQDEGSINTVLKSGSVEISYQGDSKTSEPMDKFRITPGTKASYNKKNKSIISEKVDVESYFSWRDGYLVFKQDDLRHIMKRISRYYNLKIVGIEKISSNETFSGYLDLNEDITKVMESIKESSVIDYGLSENEITIY